MRTWERPDRAGGREPRPIRSIRGWVFHTLNQHLPDDVIITADAGTTADWYGHHIRLGRHMMGNLSGRLATMLGAMPYAIAAKFAFPNRRWCAPSVTARSRCWA